MKRKIPWRPTPISSHVKDKNSIFTARDEDMIFLVKGKIVVFHQYLYNKSFFPSKGKIIKNHYNNNNNNYNNDDDDDDDINSKNRNICIVMCR